MASTDRSRLAKRALDSFAAGDREAIEALLAHDFTFSSPADPGLDRDGFFERCWPNAHEIQSFDVVRLVESGDDVIVTYEATRTDGRRFRNTEVLTFDGDRIARQEVYFGWDL